MGKIIKEKLLIIKKETQQFEAVLNVPSEASKIVIFAHGSGSSRFSPRNNYVARVLNQYGFATLLIDLLTEDEDQIYENRFDISLLTERLVNITKFISEYEDTDYLKIGYFGASTGSAVALKASVQTQNEIFAIVSRGGRPDLAMDIIGKVKSPSLFIVGSNDEYVLKLNQKAYKQMQCKKELKIVEGATHLFEEAGALENVSEISALWFQDN